MSQPSDFALRLPRPGRALKLVLGLVVGFAILGAVLGDSLLKWLAFMPGDFTSAIRDHHIPHVWAFVTSGVLTPPDVIHLLFVLVGLYFMTPELERRWGGPRLLRFLAIAVALGNFLVLVGSLLPIPRESFHPQLTIGPLAAIAAITVAWAKENWNAQSRFMAVLPMSGRTLFYGSIVLSIAAAIFSSGMSEGAFAPLGGVIAGILFSGSPSPARTAWLRFRLGSMRRQARGGVTVADLLGDNDDIDPPRSSRPSVKRSAKAPPLRIVRGGLDDDDLKNRKLPKDKRYLN